MAQLFVNNYPISFTQYSQQLPFLNPAALVSTNEWETSVSNRRNIGFWRNNQTYLAYGAFRIQPKRANNFHGLGLSLYYDKEGSYLKRYRGYMQYAYHIPLNDRWKISAGLSLGMMTYQVGNENYEGGSASNWDGSLGLFLSGKTTYLGFTIAQLPQTNIQPIYETTVLARYYQLIMGKDFDLGEEYLWKNNVNCRFLQSQDADLYLQSGVLWNQMVGLYGLYRWNRQASLLLGLEKIEWEKMWFKLFFSYDITTNGGQRYQAFEFTLQCAKPEAKRKNKKK